MKLAGLILRISQIAAGALLALAYGLAGLWLPALVLLVVAAGWAMVVPRRLDTLSSFIFACLVVAGGLAALLSAPAPLLAVAVIAALAAWDLDHFIRRTRDVQILSDTSRIERAHLRRLLLVCCLGLALSETALLVRIRFSFAFEFFLAALMLIGIGQLASWIQRKMSATEREPAKIE